MRSPLFYGVALAMLLSGCGSQQPVATPSPEPRTAVAKPADESRRFPQTNLVETKVIDKELLGKPFMPGGTLAHYKNGKSEYDMFVCKLSSATAAAVLLPDWRKALGDAKFVASFGGYFGDDAGKPVFVFTKGPWVAGIVGLPQAEADLESRTLALRLN